MPHQPIVLNTMRLIWGIIQFCNLLYSFIINRLMKTLVLNFMLAFIPIIVFAQDNNVRTYQVNSSLSNNSIPYNLQVDSVRLHVDGNNAYYQRVVKVDSNINENLIYIRSMQFMASKNFQQTYGYEEEGKLIYTTTQDLNINPVKVNDD